MALTKTGEKQAAKAIKRLKYYQLSGTQETQKYASQEQKEFMRAVRVDARVKHLRCTFHMPSCHAGPRQNSSSGKRRQAG